MMMWMNMMATQTHNMRSQSWTESGGRDSIGPSDIRCVSLCNFHFTPTELSDAQFVNATSKIRQLTGARVFIFVEPSQHLLKPVVPL